MEMHMKINIGRVSDMHDKNMSFMSQQSNTQYVTEIKFLPITRKQRPWTTPDELYWRLPWLRED